MALKSQIDAAARAGTDGPSGAFLREAGPAYVDPYEQRQAGIRIIGYALNGHPCRGRRCTHPKHGQAMAEAKRALAALGITDGKNRLQPRDGLTPQPKPRLAQQTKEG